ncbi:MAG: NADH dehydrogenase [Gammaproteobacteria bacterium]|nr:NADH dehydrogenase [Gammaproteobacteria bacterium]
MNAASQAHRIFVIGGGAGGFELVTKLGRRLGGRGLAEVVLVDMKPSHIWKPLLHEIAAGTMNAHEDELNYLYYASENHFKFRLGALESIDRRNKTLTVSPSLDDRGVEFIPRRTFAYDTLVVCIGSIANDFGVPGVREHCAFLDTRDQADQFHRDLLRDMYAANVQTGPLREGQLHIAIAGAGATGVELAAELHAALFTMKAYGLDKVDPERDVKIYLIDSADRILPGLLPEISERTARVLARIDVQIITGERITEATPAAFLTQTGRVIPAETKVWAAGIKAPDLLRDLDGLEVNGANQLLVRPTLQSTVDDDIFAFGDCAACPMPDGRTIVPPRAQAAHQQADLLATAIEKRVRGNANLPLYVYKDFGSLINLSHQSTIGNLMGNLMGRQTGMVFMEGFFARMAYLSLYKMHLLAIQGWWRVALTTLANLLTRGIKPRLKLH